MLEIMFEQFIFILILLFLEPDFLHFNTGKNYSKLQFCRNEFKLNCLLFKVCQALELQNRKSC